MAALNSASHAARCLSQLYACDRDLAPDEVNLAADLITDAGGRAWAEHEVRRRRLDTAWDMIDALDLADDPRRDLEELTAMLAASQPA
ncbi:MAG TPA: hypothetical protein VIY52_30805 [Streptosporangiaceae bacterium]